MKNKRLSICYEIQFMIYIKRILILNTYYVGVCTVGVEFLSRVVFTRASLKTT